MESSPFVVLISGQYDISAIVNDFYLFVLGFSSADNEQRFCIPSFEDRKNFYFELINHYNDTTASSLIMKLQFISRKFLELKNTRCSNIEYFHKFINWLKTLPFEDGQKCYNKIVEFALLMIKIIEKDIPHELLEQMVHFQGNIFSYFYQLKKNVNYIFECFNDTTEQIVPILIDEEVDLSMPSDFTDIETTIPIGVNPSEFNSFNHLMYYTASYQLKQFSNLFDYLVTNQQCFITSLKQSLLVFNQRNSREQEILDQEVEEETDEYEKEKIIVSDFLRTGSVPSNYNLVVNLLNSFGTISFYVAKVYYEIFIRSISTPELEDLMNIVCNEVDIRCISEEDMHDEKNYQELIEQFATSS